MSTARMSIGAVSRAVGIPVGTLRNWERRYGVPAPERTDGGHRLYGPETVGFLEMVNVAMRHGHRPAQLLRLSPEEISAIVAIDAKAGPADADAALNGSPDLMSAIKSFDSDFLFDTFRNEVARRGLANFVLDHQNGPPPELHRCPFHSSCLQDSQWCAGHLRRLNRKEKNMELTLYLQTLEEH